MSTVLDGLSKIFKHLGRDVMIYMIPGLVVLLDLAYLDYLYDTQVYDNLKNVPYRWAVFIGVLYIFGTISMAFAEIVYKWIEAWKPYNGMLSDEMASADKKPVLYEQFVERYNTLSLYRYNLRYSFLFCALLNIMFGVIYGCVHSFNGWICSMSIITGLLLVFFGLFHCLCRQTDLDYYDRVQQVMKQ